jgi:hypothetical protein
MTPRKRQSRDHQDRPARNPDPSRRPDDDISLADAGAAPVDGDDESPLGTDEEDPARPRNLQRRLAQKIEQEIEHPSPQEHPDGSAPLLDRLTQDLDPRKDR